jgi:hypothetical protein
MFKTLVNLDQKRMMFNVLIYAIKEKIVKNYFQFINESEKIIKNLNKTLNNKMKDVFLNQF